MTVKETLGALGSFEVALRDATPDFVLSRLDLFGHLAVIDGEIDVEGTGDAILDGAKYVGVVRSIGKPGERKVAGNGMVFWLGDEDDKGQVIEQKLTLTGMTFTDAVEAILDRCDAVTMGNIEPQAGQLGDTEVQFLTPRAALALVCDSFGCEFRVNFDASVDAGSPAYLYNIGNPETVLARDRSGSDLDLTALASTFATERGGYDYSTRVVLLGQTTGTADTEAVPFATGSADVPSTPYRNLLGGPVKFTRTISESGTPEGAAQPRAQLQLNRLARLTTSLNLDTEDFDVEGTFRVGDNVWVYDPDAGIENPANEIDFRGEVLHADTIRLTEVEWPVVPGYTVAYRTKDGEWIDLTPFVLFEARGTRLTVGDLPQTLSKPGDNPVSTRIDATRGNQGPDETVPLPPEELTLTTFSGQNDNGETVSVIHAEWLAPTLNEDGTVLTDLLYYVVQYRWIDRAPAWQQARVSDDTSIDIEVTPRLVYQVRVAAVDTSGHMSAWTPIEVITAARDQVAPNAPADPEVTSYLGQLRIRYIGTDADGNPMSADTNRVVVHIGTSPTFVHGPDTAVADLNPFVEGVAYSSISTYGVAQYVRLVAIDHDGNESAASATVAGATVRVNDADIQALSVGKLTAGTITADIVNAGRFTTALAGARVEHNALGVQKFEADNSLTVSITGSTNLFAGKYMTALAGRRIEMGSAGTTGEIDFFAPDNRKAFIKAYTESTGKEAIQFGIEVPGVENAGLWNRINYNATTGGGEYATYRSGTHEFIFDKGTPNFGRFVVFDTVARDTNNTNARFEIADETIQFWDSNGDQRMLLDDDNWNIYGVDAVQRPRITFRKTDGYFIIGTDQPNVYMEIQAVGTTAHNMGTGLGRVEFRRGDSENGAKIVSVNGAGNEAQWRLRYPAAGTLRWEARDIGDTIWIPIWASAFTVNSDRSTKGSIKDAPAGALAKVMNLPVREYRRRQHDGSFGPKEIGFVTDEAPSQIVVVGGPEEGETGIDLYQTVALLAQAIQELGGKK